MDPGEHVREVEEWHARRLARLTAPDGWLAITGLFWLRDGQNTVGGHPSCRVVLPEGRSPARLGSIDVAGPIAVARFSPGSGVSHDGQLVTEMRLNDDTEGHPTVLTLGPVLFHIIQREGRLAVRVRDTDSPRRRSVGPIERFPVDPAWRLDARFEPHDPPVRASVPTSAGVAESYPIPGAVAFEAGGATHRLDAFLEPGETEHFIVYADLTNGEDTYGGGRYVYAPPPDTAGRTVLDFNKSYNPPCVFSPYVTCPLPLPQNRLPFRVEAGEKRYRG